MNDILQKGGEVSENSNFECVNKSDILLREGGEAKLMSFFQDRDVLFEYHRAVVPFC